MRHGKKVIHMSRTLAAVAIGILFAGTGRAAEESPPPLTAPAVTAPVVTAPTETKPMEPKKPAASRIPESRPVLVIPGVTAPARVRSQPRVATSPNPEPAPPQELPAFEIPQEMLEPKPREIPRRPAAASRAATPPVVESIPRSSDRNASPTFRPRPQSTPRVPGGAPTPRSADASAPRDAEPLRRPPGLFGRLFAPPFAMPRSAVPERSPITVEPRVDPAADAALQRRVEKQVRESVGDRVRFYEVRVIDRDVTVRVRVSRFWQRRSVRSAIEALPALSGYRARVEVVD